MHHVLILVGFAAQNILECMYSPKNHDNGQRLVDDGPLRSKIISLLTLLLLYHQSAI